LESDDLFGRIRLAYKHASKRQFGLATFQPPRCDNSLDRRPAITNPVNQPYAVHRTRHIDIGEYEVDIVVPFENADRLVGVFCFVRSESCRRNCFNRNHSNNRFVLNDEDADRVMPFNRGYQLGQQEIVQFLFDIFVSNSMQFYPTRHCHSTLRGIATLIPPEETGAAPLFSKARRCIPAKPASVAQLMNVVCREQSKVKT
jgi:hypothetical protein